MTFNAPNHYFFFSRKVQTKYDLSKKLKETMANFQYSTTNTPKVYEEQVTGFMY